MPDKPRRRARQLILACLLALVPISGVSVTSPAFAQATVPIRFDPGRSGATINGTVRGHDYVDYVLGVRAGQQMNVDLKVTGTNGNGSAFFNILPAGQNYPALFVGSNEGRSASVTIPSDGNWAIRVYLMGNDKDADKTVGFTIDVSIPASSGSGGSSASGSGLLPEEDIFVVNLGNPGGYLNARDAPRTNGRLVGRFPDGATLANVGGCTMSDGAQWCKVQGEGGGIVGWVAARFLALPAPGGGSGGSSAQSGGATNAQASGTTGDVRVKFAPGASGATYTNRLGSGEAVTYILNARDGQFLTVDLTGDTNHLDYIIYVPGGDILDQASQSSFRYEGQLYRSGDHRVQVFYNGNQGTFSNFTIRFEIR